MLEPEPGRCPKGSRGSRAVCFGQVPRSVLAQQMHERKGIFPSDAKQSWCPLRGTEPPVPMSPVLAGLPRDTSDLCSLATTSPWPGRNPHCGGSAMHSPEGCRNPRGARGHAAGEHRPQQRDYSFTDGVTPPLPANPPSESRVLGKAAGLLTVGDSHAYISFRLCISCCPRVRPA